MALKREIKDAYIEGGNSIYVKTHSNAIYVDDNETETLTQRLDNVKSSITKHTTQLNDIVNLNDGTNVQTFLNNIEDNTNIKIKKSIIEVDNVLVLENKNNVTLDLSNVTFNQNKHGYGVLEIKNCTNTRIKGGIFIGAGNFPEQTIDSSEKIHNEKKDCPNDWGTHKNGEYKTGGSYNNGYLYNVSFGILILEGCSNIIVEESESYGFNYVGIGIGFRGKIDGEINKNIVIRNCYCHDNFCAGIHVMHVDGFDIYNNKCENNGHPSALLTDKDCDPGYGIACRNSNSYPINGDIHNNIVNNNKRKGIDVHSGQYITISDNKVTNNYAYGIALTRFNGSVSDIIIDKNTIINSGNVKGKPALLCDSSGINIISNNKLINSGISGAGIEARDSEVIIKNNILNGCATDENSDCAITANGCNTIIKGNLLINSGKKYGLKSYPTKYSIIENNVFNSDISHIKAFVNGAQGENSCATISNNIFNNEIVNGMDLHIINTPCGIISGNKFTDNSLVMSTTSGLQISDDNINLKGSAKNTSGEISNSITTVTVEISNGVITWSDTNGIVTDVVDLDKGIIIKTKTNRIIKGFSYQRLTTATTDVTDVVVRSIDKSRVDISLLTADQPVYGQSSSSITYFKGMFTLNVI